MGCGLDMLHQELQRIRRPLLIVVRRRSMLGGKATQSGVRVAPPRNCPDQATNFPTTTHCTPLPFGCVSMPSGPFPFVKIGAMGHLYPQAEVAASLRVL